MATMRCWQYKGAHGGLEKALYLPEGGVRKPVVFGNEVLVEVYSAALNPIDYKVPEQGFVGKLMAPLPPTPGLDFCGKVIAAGNTVDNLREGEMVWGACHGRSLAYGSLSEFVAVPKDLVQPIPEGIDPDHAAGVPCTGITAMQSIKPNIKEGDKVFINGGSGGTGTFMIQVAKALGCHVTTTCSTANVELCRSLGADEVIDYKTTDVAGALMTRGQVFNLIVDNIGIPANLYKLSHHFLVPHGRYVQVGAPMGFGAVLNTVSNILRPGFLGGGKRPFQQLMVKPNADDMLQLGNWVKAGKVRTVIDSTWEWEDVPKAFEKLKTGRAKGKIIVHVKKV